MKLKKIFFFNFQKIGSAGSYKKQVDSFVFQFQLQWLQNQQKDLKTEIEHLNAQKTELISENVSKRIE